MTPIGGGYLQKMRLEGKRPPGFVVVTESRDVAKNALQRDLYSLVFDPDEAYDWTLLHALDVRLVTWLKRERLTSLCQAIMEVSPKSFGTTYFTLYSDNTYDSEAETVIPHAAP